MDDQEHVSRGRAAQVLQQGEHLQYKPLDEDISVQTVAGVANSVHFLRDRINERERLTFPSRFQKKGDQPTGQQRRKHQITYLIHQAKERELELKNNWADNKMTRRQTQAKYGF